MKTLSKIYMWVVFALLYAPILVLILFSFNDAGSLNNFSTFSFKWYGELFRDTVYDSDRISFSARKRFILDTVVHQ